MSLENVLLNKDSTLQSALKLIDISGLGIVFIIDDENKLLGVLTDGDVRRHLLAGAKLNNSIKKLYNHSFFSLHFKSKNKLILNSFNEDIKVIPLIDDNDIVVDYATKTKTRTINMASPNLHGNELAYVHKCIEENWISSQGAFVYKFEKIFSEFLNKNCLTVSNGTVAIHLALEALGISKGDEVIVPNLTFAATINAVIYTGAKPVISDVDLKTWNITISEIEKVITPKTKALIVVHLYGNSCYMDEIADYCRKKNILLIEDCAESIGTTYNSSPSGTYGDASTFSFFGNKTITTGEGGMVAFKNKDIFNKAQILRDHGMSKDKRYWHDMVGFNYRLTNIQAAIGVAQFERLENFVTRKNHIANSYINGLNNNNLVFQKITPNSKSSYWLFSLLLSSNLERNKLQSYLIKKGIETRPIFYTLDEMPIYKKYSNGKTPNSRSISEKGISLPTFPSLSEDEIKFIINTINNFFINHE